MVLRSMLSPRVRNPLVESEGRRSVEPFPVTNNLLAPVKALGSGLTAELTIESLFRLQAILANACDKPISDITSPPKDRLNTAGSAFIMSNSGYAAFFATNKDVLGNRDTFGVPIDIQGIKGTLRMLHGSMFITIPDKYYQMFAVPTPTTANGRTEGTAVAGDFDTSNNVNRLLFPASASAFNLTPATEYGTTAKYAAADANTITSGNLYNAIMVYPGSMEISTAPQLEVMPEINTNPTKANEKFLMARISLDYMKLYQEGIWRIWYTDKNQRVLRKA